jgi:hypothetical protein
MRGPFTPAMMLENNLDGMKEKKGDMVRVCGTLFVIRKRVLITAHKGKKRL